MKNLFTTFIILFFTSMTFAESALLNKYNLNEEALNEIELRVSSMSEDELIERKEYLEAAIVELEETKNTRKCLRIV